MPKKVTASIDIPASYYVEVWKQRNPQPADKTAKPPDAAELATIETEIKQRIKETVRNLLPDVDKGTNPYPHIVVETYTDLPTDGRRAADAGRQRGRPGWPTTGRRWRWSAWA